LRISNPVDNEIGSVKNPSPRKERFPTARGRLIVIDKRLEEFPKGRVCRSSRMTFPEPSSKIAVNSSFGPEGGLLGIEKQAFTERN
jgi:hypothetical protein